MADLLELPAELEALDLDGMGVNPVEDVDLERNRASRRGLNGLERAAFLPVELGAQIDLHAQFGHLHFAGHKPTILFSGPGSPRRADRRSIAVAGETVVLDRGTVGRESLKLDDANENGGRCCQELGRPVCHDVFMGPLGWTVDRRLKRDGVGLRDASDDFRGI